MQNSTATGDCTEYLDLGVQKSSHYSVEEQPWGIHVSESLPGSADHRC